MSRLEPPVSRGTVIGRVAGYPPLFRSKSRLKKNLAIVRIGRACTILNHACNAC